MKTVAQILKHDFSNGDLSLYDSNGNEIYYENSNGYWFKREYDTNGNRIYYETSDGFWSKYDYDSNNNHIYLENSTGYWFKREFDDNGNCIYYETSNGYIFDNRPKTSCNGKVVEIDGKRYQLKEVG
jgi:hypothetical protein